MAAGATCAGVRGAMLASEGVAHTVAKDSALTPKPDTAMPTDAACARQEQFGLPYIRAENLIIKHGADGSCKDWGSRCRMHACRRL